MYSDHHQCLGHTLGNGYNRIRNPEAQLGLEHQALERFPMHLKMPRLLLIAAVWCSSTLALADPPKLIGTIEGITEYRLDNGMQVLLFPDSSKPVVTVNLTLFVGSRHEGYGEAGMAHLLEHMLFKGTPNHQDIPKMLGKRGADFNGTTWTDRTNYYETLPAEGDNLEFAIRLEADRMINSWIKGEDLASEMTVVRSEFEQGEDSPSGVLSERIAATAYRWHNYGQTTIGNQSDIERVPIDRLQAFYRKYYRPDNAMLVVAGAIDPADALDLVEKYFGVLDNPPVPLEKTYTQEPPQDGERQTVVRRVGKQQLVGVSYHVPSGGDPEYPAITILNSLMASEPSGRLYRGLVESKLATSITGEAIGQHDPGLMTFMATLPPSLSLEKAQSRMLEILEGIEKEPITKQEVERAIADFLKAREFMNANSTSLATQLSEWGAQGDWRLYFLFRDRMEQTTAEDVQRVAVRYLSRNNRTLGLFVPSETSERVTIPARPDLSQALAGYQGRQEVSEGESLDADLAAIQARVESGVLASGIRYNFLTKKSRGDMVSLLLTLRFGNLESLKNKRAVCDLLGTWMSRGTQSLDYQGLQDRLSQLRASVQLQTQAGLLQLRLDVKRSQLPDAMDLCQELLRKPGFVETELDVVRSEMTSQLEASMTEPQALAPLAVNQALNPYSKDDVRYTGTLEETLQAVKAVTADQIKQLYAEMLGGSTGEVVVVGDFESETVKSAVESWTGNWIAKVPFERVPQPANVGAAGGTAQINTPDKANSVFFAAEHLPIRDDHPDYAALALGNYILGGGTLSSRLMERVRQQEGLSYGIGSGLTAHPVDQRTVFMIYAIANPANMEKLSDLIRQELAKWVENGVSTEELEEAKQGYLQSLVVERSGDASIAGILASNLFAKRTLQYQVDFEKKIKNLKAEDVNRALKAHMDLKRLIIRSAGDFPTKATSSEK